MQDHLHDMLKLFHRNPMKVSCIYTDASEVNWGLFFTQCAKEDLGKQLHEQSHEPPAFFGSDFKVSEEHGTTF